MEQLFCRMERDGKVTTETTAVNEAVYEVVRQLAIEVGVIPNRHDGKRACTLAVQKMLEIYKGEHGVSGLTDAVEAELQVLLELHPDRVQVRRVCYAHKGISCDYAIARGDGKNGLNDLCTYQNGCELSREEAV